MCTETKQILAEQGSVFHPILQCSHRHPTVSSTHGLAYDITLTKADGNSGVSCQCDLPCELVDFDSL